MALSGVGDVARFLFPETAVVGLAFGILEKERYMIKIRQ